MLIENKEIYISTLKKIREKICGYVGTTCDCKFGFASKGTDSEKTGCPEIRCLIHLLEVMTEKEFQTILKRAANRLKIPKKLKDAKNPNLKVDTCTLFDIFKDKPFNGKIKDL